MLIKFLRSSLERFINNSTGLALLSVLIVLALSVIVSGCSPGYLECDGLSCSVGQGTSKVSK